MGFIPRRTSCNLLTDAILSGIMSSTGDHIMLMFDVESIEGVLYYRNDQYEYIESSIQKYKLFLPDLVSTELEPTTSFVTMNFELVVRKSNEDVDMGFEYPLYPDKIQHIILDIL